MHGTRPEAGAHQVAGPDIEPVGDAIRERARGSAQDGEDCDLGRSAQSS